MVKPILFAGLLADAIGRKRLMILSGILFAVSIPIIALSRGYNPLILGRLCQGVSAGLIGVVVPLYLAECLAPEERGQGTAMFQWLLTIGIVAAAGVGMYFSLRVDEVAKLGNAQLLFKFKDHAWRSIFWVSLPPRTALCAGLPLGGRIAAMAVPARERAACLGSTLAFTISRAGPHGVERNGTEQGRGSDQSGGKRRWR